MPDCATSIPSAAPHASQPAAVTDDEIRRALDRATKYVEKRTRGEAGEVAYDAAVDAIVWASKNYRPEHGPFENYCNRLTKQFIGRALVKLRERARARPGHEPLPDYDLAAKSLPIAGEIPMTADLADLPDDLRDAVRFYMIDGFTMQEIGLLCGMSAATVRMRLIAAARKLNPGVRLNHTRAKGERRLIR